uniref:MAGUK p55 scaffold protein 7a n=1 Tax=Seriola dumerili TaxID=41447 RepID=A0A3B4TG69_SERDU
MHAFIPPTAMLTLCFLFPPSPGLYELLAALPSQLQPHVSRPEDNTFLQDMFGERSLHSLVKVKLKKNNTELKFCLMSLLTVHDAVAQKSYDPELPPLPEDIDDDEDSVKIIRLVKNKEPLGATIMRDEHTGAILVARIMRGGAADRSGLIHVGDELKEVNGIPVDDKKPEEIIRILAQSQGAITFKVVPSVKEEPPTKEPKVFVKALFDYDPKEDKAIPCKEAGLAFKKGSILQIMSQDDATWWQAKLEGDANPRAGLIPSKQFQERRFALRRPVATLPFQRSSSRRSSGFRRSFRLSRRDKKTNKSMYECKKSEMYDMADVPTYEEVTPYRRQSGGKHRLVVLVGPTGVGLNELKRKLLITDAQHFSVTIPHTSRAKRNQESDGVEYHFISKNLFETDIHNNNSLLIFLTPHDYAIDKCTFKLLSHSCFITVLPSCCWMTTLHTLLLHSYLFSFVSVQTIKHLRTAEFKPFVVFVKPPAIERLRETRKNARIISGKDDKGSAKPFTEEDFQEMVSTAQSMETQYGHLFEKVIVNDDLSAAFSELRLALKKIETETHWVPVSWTHS